MHCALCEYLPCWLPIVASVNPFGLLRRESIRLCVQYSRRKSQRKDKGRKPEQKTQCASSRSLSRRAAHRMFRCFFHLRLSKLLVFLLLMVAFVAMLSRALEVYDELNQVVLL